MQGYKVKFPILIYLAVPNQMRFFAISVWISSVYDFSIGLVRF